MRELKAAIAEPSPEEKAELKKAAQALVGNPLVTKSLSRTQALFADMALSSEDPGTRAMGRAGIKAVDYLLTDLDTARNYKID